MYYKILFLFILIFSNNAMADNITPYEINKKITDNIEIREYKTLLLAKVSANESNSDNNLFRTLFKFISGENKSSKKISMTTPVFEVKNGNEVSMFFAMPAEFSKSNLPKPNDKNIKIEEIKNQKFIVITFSRRSSDSNFKKYQEILAEKINDENIKADLSNPIRAFYNHPWTLPFLKRNEVLFKLE